MAGKHLFISLARSGWGEATLGLAVAHEMRNAGDEVLFLVSDHIAPLVTAAQIPWELIQESLGPLVGLFIESLLIKERVTSIVLTDNLVCGEAFQRMGIGLDILGNFGIPVLAIDTWNHLETGTSVDLVDGSKWSIPAWSSAITHSIVPVPFNRPTAKNACSFLPALRKLPRRVREHVRKDLGLSQEDRLMVMCSSEWQSNPRIVAGQRLGTAVPLLLCRYFDILGSRFHLLHFAPIPSDGFSDLNDRYHWIPSSPPLIREQFQAIVGSADAVISLNYSATTNNIAFALGIPVLLVKNSCEAKTFDDVAEWLGCSPGTAVKHWINNGALPFARFRMWPLGFYEFLEPAFRDNQLLDACVEIELLNEDAFISGYNQIVFDDAWKEAFQDRSTSYVSRVTSLPRPGALIRELLGSAIVKRD
jgi:Family of unknown function (DUF6365)